MRVECVINASPAKVFEYFTKDETMLQECEKDIVAMKRLKVLDKETEIWHFLA